MWLHKLAIDTAIWDPGLSSLFFRRAAFNSWFFTLLLDISALICRNNYTQNELICPSQTSVSVTDGYGFNLHFEVFESLLFSAAHALSQAHQRLCRRHAGRHLVS